MEIQETSRLTRLATQLVAAKQDLVNMGYPEIIAKLFYERYGKFTPMVANWYRGYIGAPHSDRPNWWELINSYSNRGIALQSLVRLYEEGLDPESFRQICDHEGFRLEDYPDSKYMVDEYRRELIPEIRENFFKNIFFTYSHLMQAINSGELKDVAPYKKLKFTEAEAKYDERRHVEGTTPLKVYQNGFKWIDTGKKSVFLAQQMKNCGSAGLMSMDKDRTILTLFGPNNKPHVMVVYSPNDKRISGDECAGSTPVKPEYHDYVLDLANELGARFDATKSKSKSLRVKYMLKDKAQSIEQLQFEDPASYSHDVYFRFVSDGQEYYTNGEEVVSGADVDHTQKMVESGEWELPYPQEEPYKNPFVSRGNRDFLEQYGNVKYTPLGRFVGAW